MIRDFTSEAEEKLLSLVAEVEDEQWFGWTDALGDLCSDVGAWFGGLDVKDYVDDMNKYHKKVIDKNDTSKEEIHKIFDAVYSADDGYKARFCSLAKMNELYSRNIRLLASQISAGTLNKDKIAKAKAGIYTNGKSREIYARIAGNGLLEQNVQDMDPQDLTSILDSLGEMMLETGHLEKEKEVRIPLGPYMEYYYKHKVEVGTSNVPIGSNAPFNFKFDDDNKLKMDNITGKLPIFNKAGFLKFSSKGEIGIEAEKAGIGPFDKMGGTFSIGKDGIKGDARATLGDLTLKTLYDKDGAGFSITRNDNGDLYTFKAQENMLQRKVEYSATIKLDDKLKVTDTHGLIIKKHGDPDQRLSKFQRMAIPDEIASPYSCQMPQLTLEDFDWELSVEILEVTGAVILVVATGGTAMAAAPEILAAGGAAEATAIGGTAIAGTTVVAAEGPQIQMIVTEGEQFVAEHSAEIIQAVEDLLAA